MKFKKKTTLEMAGKTILHEIKKEPTDFDFAEIQHPPALAGVLTTRTSDNSGVITIEGTMPEWVAEGAALGLSFLGGVMRVFVVSSDSTTITVNAGSLNDLPTQASPVVVGKIFYSVIGRICDSVGLVVADSTFACAVVLLSEAVPDNITSFGYIKKSAGSLFFENGQSEFENSSLYTYLQGTDTITHMISFNISASSGLLTTAICAN